jgi:two-component system KDP operon response regulator KdpE
VKPRPKALIIEEEPASRRLARFVLENENYRVFAAADGASGSRLAASCRPDVVILDPGLLDMGGTVWLQSFREWSPTPVMVLSASSRSVDKVAALDAGANDYVVKPFDSAELLARLRVLRRCTPGIPDGPFLIEGELRINLAAHEVFLDGRRLKFTATEEAVFYLLARYAGKVVTCGHLLRAVWGNDAENKLHELQVLIARIRKKLEDEERVMIRTEERLGYQLVIGERVPRSVINDETEPLRFERPVI